MCLNLPAQDKAVIPVGKLIERQLESYGRNILKDRGFDVEGKRLCKTLRIQVIVKGQWSPEPWERKFSRIQFQKFRVVGLVCDKCPVKRKVLSDPFQLGIDKPCTR